MTPESPLEVLVVGWFPSATDVFAGRFVADQVAAIASTGDIRPWVATFENLNLAGDGLLRDREEQAVRQSIALGIGAARSPFAQRGAAGPRGIPVARLGVSAGQSPASGQTHGEIHHATSLGSLVERPDHPDWRLVHGHVGYPEGIAALTAARRLGVPFVLTEHATYLAKFFTDPLLRVRYAAALRGASRIITVSRMLGGEILSELGNQIPGLAERMVAIPNTVAVGDFRPVGLADRRRDELLWVGNRTPLKGIDTLLRAFALARAERPSLTLRLVGRSTSDDAEEGWIRLASALGVRDAVAFDGPADRAGVAAAMERAALFVHASTRETFGVVAVEALAAGLPVVACDSGGVTEVLGPTPLQFGAVVPHSQPVILSQAILGALDRRGSFDPALLHETAEREFGAAAVAERIRQLYREVMDEAVGWAADVPREPRPTQVGGGVGTDAGLGGTGSSDAATNGMGSPDSRQVAARATEGHPLRHLVVGFQRSALDRTLEATPGWVTDGARIVTTGGPLADGRFAGRTVLAEAGTERRVVELIRWGMKPTGKRSLGWRIRRLMLWPLRWIRLVRRRRWLAEGVLDQLRATVDRAIDETQAATEGGNADVVIVSLGGLDVLAAAPIFAAGRARPAPGGIRWLADQVGEPASSP